MHKKKAGKKKRRPLNKPILYLLKGGKIDPKLLRQAVIEVKQAKLARVEN
jgi:hypothetical protein